MFIIAENVCDICLSSVTRAAGMCMHFLFLFPRKMRPSLPAANEQLSYNLTFIQRRKMLVNCRPQPLPLAKVR